MRKVYSHEELFGRRVAVLLRVEDVEVVLGQYARHRVYNAWSVWTRQCEDVVICCGHLGVSLQSSRRGAGDLVLRLSKNADGSPETEKATH